MECAAEMGTMGLPKRKYRPMWIKLFLYIFAVMTLPILLLAFLANQLTTDSLTEQKRQADLNVIRNVDSYLSSLLDSVENYGRLIALREDLQEFMAAAERAARDDKAVYRTLDATGQTQPLVDSLTTLAAVSLLSADGFFIGEQTLEPNRLSYFFNPTDFAKLDRREITWTNSFAIRFLAGGRETRVIAATVPLYAGEEFLGFAVLCVDTGELQKPIRHIEDNIYIIGGFDSSYVLVSNQQIPFYMSLYNYTKISYNLLREDSSVIVAVDRDTLIVTTQSYNRLQVQFVLVSSFNNIGEGALVRASSIFYYCLYLVVFSLVAALIVAALISRPIACLRRVVAEAHTGALSSRCKITGQDEIAQLGISFNSLLDRIETLMEQNRIQQEMKDRLRLQLIQSQIQPHFLYNVLEMVSSFVQENMREEAVRSIHSLADFYRVSLNNGSDIIPIEQEIQLVENYLTLQHMRYVEFMDFRLSFHPSIHRYRLPKLTLQPIVENAIYHGLKGRCAPGLLCVTGYLQDSRIVFEIYDNGVGMPPEALAGLREAIRRDPGDTGQAFGLGSVIRRLNLHFEGRAELRIDSEQGRYTNVTISVPAEAGRRKEDAQHAQGGADRR